MKKFLTALISGGLCLAVGLSFADSHEGEAAEANVAAPVEMFTCKYNKGKGPTDFAAVVKRFNAWGDENGLEDYTAFSLVPYYASAEQDFDTLWLGVTTKARSMGRSQDKWLATGGKIQQAFDEVAPCDSHLGFAALQIKAPPKRENPSNIVFSFSDCNTMEGTTFDDLYMPLMEWGKYKAEHGSTAGMWVFFPSYGGGGEEFEFKFVATHQNLEDQGADWDQYSETGWQKANELFAGKLDCDSARVYLGTNVRRAKDAD